MFAFMSGSAVRAAGRLASSLRTALVVLVSTAAAGFAAPLTLVQEPAGKGHYTALVTDVFSGTGVANGDEWSFEAEAGDRVTVRVETAVAAASPRLRLVNASTTTIASVDGGNDGVANLNPVTITTPGTYRVRVYSDSAVSTYTLRFSLGRGVDLEVEPNDLVANATVVTPVVAAGQFAFSLAGLAPAADSAGDHLSLGQIPAGATLNAGVQLSSSSLTPADISLQLFTTPLSDGSLSFNGATYATVPHNAVFDAIETARAFSVEAWIFIRSWPDSYFTIIDKYRQTGDMGWAVAIENGGGGLSLFPASNQRASSNVTPSLNTWHHVVATYDHAANNVRFYIDGELVATRTSPGALNDTSGDPAYIGYSPSGANEFSNGLIAEVRLWNRALTTEEVQTNFAASSIAGNSTGLVGLWRFDEGSGLTANDLTANANHAVLGGGSASRVPTWSTGVVRPLAPVNGTSLSHTPSAASLVWLKVAAANNRGLSATYFASGTVSDNGGLNVVTTSLPAAGGTTSEYLQGFTVTFDDELNPVAANNLSNFELRGAGADGVFETGDDILYQFSSPGYINGTIVNLNLANGPLQAGAHRLTIGLGLQDRYGNPMASTYTLNFTSQQLGRFVIENQGNNTIATATSIAPLAADGDGFLGGGRGNLTNGSDLDFYSFPANAGDRIIITTENPDHVNATGLYYVLYRPDQNDITQFGTYNGTGQTQFIAPTTGNYYVRVSQNHVYFGEYRFSVSVFPWSGNLESEDNDSVGQADGLTWSNNGATRTASVAGVINYGDSTDWFALGYLDVGTGIDLAATKPPSSTLVWILDILDAGSNVVISAPVGTPALNYIVPTGKAGNYYARVRVSEGASILGHYRLALTLGDTSSPTIVSDTLPAEGSTLTDFFGHFALTFSENMQAASVNDSGSYDLRAAGADGLFDTADDEIYTVVTTSNYTSGLSASYRLSDGPTQPGLYRFRARTSLADTYGNTIAAPYTRTFSVAGVANFTLESRSNDTFATATPLDPLTADGTGFLGRARGNVSSGSDVDNFSFTATAGDRIILATENPAHVNATGLYYLVYSPTQSVIAQFGTYNGTGQTQFVASTTGTYYVRVQYNHASNTEYRFAVITFPEPVGLESEGNDNSGEPDAVAWTVSSGAQTAAMAGLVAWGDPGDWFTMGFLDVGTTVTVTAAKTPSSSLEWVLDVLDSSSVVVATSAVNAATLSYTIPSGKAGTHYARIRASSGASLLAQYRLTFAIGDTNAPVVTNATVPAEGATVTDFYGDFQVSFSETMRAATVNDTANYDLRAAGADGQFGTADDAVYTVGMLSNYTSGLTANLRVSDGPLQPGTYRLQVKTGLLDLYGNPLASVYTRNFSIAEVPGFVFESRSNNTSTTATTMSPTGVSAAFAGSWHPGVDFPTAGAAPTGLATADFNQDGRLDLVTANYDGGTISVLLGNGDGTFGTATTYPAPNNPFKVAVGDLNGDNRPDVVVSRRSGAAVRVFLNANNGTGALLAGTDLAMPTGPIWLALLDLNGDGSLDIATANYEGNSFSVRYNNNDGTFAAPANTAVTGNPYSIAAGDLNNDGRVDLAIGTWNPRVVHVFYRQADGSYAAGGVLSWSAPDGVSCVEIADINGDNRADLMALTDSSTPSVRRWHQQPDGTLVEADALGFGGNVTGYTVHAIDYDADGDRDVLVGRNSNVAVFEALGNGTFAGPMNLSVGNNARHVVVADFNADNRPDVVTAVQQANAVRVFLGRGAEVLAADGDGYIGRIRGQIGSSGDLDFYSFTAKAGDRIIIGTENPAHANATGQYFIVYRPDLAQVTEFSTYNGTNQTQFVAPISGTYFVRVSQNHGYYGEYRVAVAVLPGTMSLESEANGSAGEADSVAWSATTASQFASVAGVLYYGDTGDWFRLGSLAEGTQITVAAVKPPSSSLDWIVDIINPGGAVVSSGAVNATPVTYSVAGGGAGLYYARIRASTGASLLAQYRLTLTISDTQAPAITGTTLPESGAPITTLFDRFTIQFSKDMDPATVNDVANYDLRTAGSDNTFDTADDGIVSLQMLATYNAGVSASLRTANLGTLPVGSYRFRALSGLKDKFGNTLAPVFTHTFSVAQLTGYTYDSEPNNTRNAGTELELDHTQQDVSSGGGRGYLYSTSDTDFWSFTLLAGDRVYIQGEVPGDPGASGLSYALVGPTGTILSDVNATYNGSFSLPVHTATMGGVYSLRVTHNHGYTGEYRFRVYIMHEGVQVESEPNNTLATATPMILAASGNNRGGSLQGTSRLAGDLDYINLGTLNAGTTVFLSTRQPGNSTFVPVVSLYDANGNLVGEATGGRSGDPVAQVPISVTATYYALVRTSGATFGLASEYILDVLVVPTEGISFPNLQVTSLTPPPATGLKSGDSTTITFRVDNLGNLATAAVTWVDRVVLSTDAVYSNDDLEIAVFNRAGPLNATSHYLINSAPIKIPDGISGNYYVIVRTDHTNTVTEFVLEGDNETVTDAPIAITRADYPDLVIENLTLTGPDANGQRTASWVLANRGTGTAAAGYSERFAVRNIGTGAAPVNLLKPVAVALAKDQTLPREEKFTTSAAGNYLVEVTADAETQRYEFNAIGHTEAETNNVAATNFSITQLFSVTVAADPVSGGTVTGAGTFAEGTSTTVTATPTAPHIFLGWFEGNFLRSVNASYVFPLLSNRNLTARFGLPSYTIAAQVAPANSGIVTGGGIKQQGAPVSLSASALPGYVFQKWTEGGNDLGSVTPLTFTASADRTIVANFSEANPSHTVTVATSPANVAAVTGAGTYTNGQSASISAPATVVSGNTEYVFERFTLNGAPVSTSPTINKTFTTLDAATLAYVAEYRSQTLKPSVVEVLSNAGNRVGIGSNFQLTLRFDRAMNAQVKPVVELLSTNASSVPSVPANGNWTAPDTYVVPAITVGSNHGGDYRVRVSAAQDAQNRAMDPAEVFTFTIDVTAPAVPTLTAGPVTATSASVTWNGYSAPADLASFRVYRSTTSFSSLSGLSPIASVAASVRDYAFTGLTLDTDYYVAVVAVDTVGNAATSATPLVIRISSTVPPAIDFNVAALSSNAARLTWTFNPAGQIGFAGFKVYRHTAPFTSLGGLTPIATLTPDKTSHDDLNLDRSLTHYYTVVGYNVRGESITDVVSKPWVDPLANTISSDFTASEPVLIINQPLKVTNGATFTVPAGTVVAFGPGGGLTVEAGRLVVEGTAFAPVVFTSLADVDNTGPTRGTWNGITLADGTRSSTLRHTWVKYGKGLSITAGTHTVESFGAAWNEVAGLGISGSATLTTTKAYLSNNAIGASISGSGSLTISGSVLKNNTVNAAATGSGVLNASGNWWGTTDAAAIAASISGPVNTASPLSGEPILTQGIRSADGASSTGVANVPLRLASANAVSYRLSEDSSFAGALFVDVPRDPLSPDLFNTNSWPVTFTLSAGAGTKTIYAQFRSPTGEVSDSVSFAINYVTTGPVIATFSLNEGQTVNRPLVVNATANSPLPIANLTFYVDDVIVATSTTTALAANWDVRSLTPGLHRVRVAAVDTAGNSASRSLNVVFNATPPPRPVITAPANGLQTTATQVTVTGTAEPLATLRVLRNGAVVGTTTATEAGAFSVANIALVEGGNELVVTAYDSIGSTPSQSVFVNADTGAPAAVTLLPISFNADEGVFLDWELPTSGEIPVLYRVVWSNAPFTNAAQATGQSAQMLATYTVLQNLPDGVYYFAVVGYDAAGNASPISNVQTYTVDLTPPAFSIAYNQTMPVGPGSLGITVTASEALVEEPVVLMKLEGGALLTITLESAGGNNYTATFPVTTLSARTGAAAIAISGEDVAGNRFTGAPTGPSLVFDLTKPTGVISTSVASPIQTSTSVTMSVSLVLSEPVKDGTQPTLNFSPPLGAQVPVPLSGSGTNWSGQLTVTSAMDNGMGTFLLNAVDAVDNIGTVITSGEKLELYNTPTPTPPAVPGNLTIEPLKGGYIRLKWNAADKAHSYRLYREAGSGAAVPTTLVTSDITTLTIDDLPPADGTYRYVVTAYRLGAESGPSGVRATTSDRTPPPAPTATTAALGASGINISWTPGSGDPVAKWVIYRNGTAIRTIANPLATSFVDSPPRGVMNYVVAAADVLGNEANGPSATIELLVGAVSNLRATVDPEVGTMLSWASTDNTAVGYNVYRNDSKQNSAPLTELAYLDTLAANGEPVTYKVTAVNASAQESAARVVEVQPVTALVRLNPTDDGDLRSVSRYFDTYSIAITVGAKATKPVSFTTGEIIRTVTGESPTQALFSLPTSIAVGETETATAVISATNVLGVTQGTAITLQAASDLGGSTVAYRMIQDFDGANASGLMMTVSSVAPPLAGGETDFTVQVFNNGHAPADLIITRKGNTEPGDLEMLIVDEDGVLVSTTPMQNTVPGVLINEKGDSFLRLDPGESVQIPFDGIIVPENLSQQTVTFRARFKAIYHDLGSTEQRVAGPLEGSMESSLTVTPYYATATTTQTDYADNQPVIITGTAINRATGQPQANAEIRIGIRVRGAVIYETVTTDANGAYSFAYTPSLGISGELVIWAAHPDIVDQLNQARVKFYRIYTNPGRLEAVMSKNDTLDFDVALLNTSDIALGAPAISFRAYRIEGGSEVAVPGLTGTARSLPAALAPKSEPKLGLRLQADLSVPDDALFEFTITTPEGATTKLGGTISFRPALAVVTVTSPTGGYAEAGVARGQLKSVDVTVENRGLRTLTNAKITPPTNTPWIQLNLATDSSGSIPLQDIPVGGSRSFTVVFAPPADQPVGFYSDFLTITGDNSTGSYRLNLFATVTSEEKGSALFTVTNTFGNPVPNTSIWLRNTTLGTEVGPVLTDVNGKALVEGLMEGDWQWKTQAAGHGATQGVITIVPGQTVGVETELFVTMVTVKFSVVPVPFTDYYEIKIEQTFQTRTPIPNLVMSPPHQSLSVEAGWSGTLLYTLRNEGLRSVFDVKVHDANLPTMRVTPLVSFIPEIKAQETIQIPVFFEYFGPAEEDVEAELQSGLGVTYQTKGGPRLPAAKAAVLGGRAPIAAAGSIGDFLDCYKEFKYGTITFKAEGGISSVSNKPYTVGVNATIDVDELLAFVCKGDCPNSWTGGGTIGKIADKACGKLAKKIIKAAKKKTKVIDIVCKASNIIKAIACAAAQLPTGTIQRPPPSSGGGGGGGTIGGDGFRGGGWTVDFSGCFVAGTPVTLADGSTLPIEAVGKGARLLASVQGRADTVAQVMALTSDHVRELTYRIRGNDTAEIKSLRLTHDHRVWIDGRGWVFAADVKSGEWLHGADGALYEVLGNTRLSGIHNVYGLHMDGDNVIYAGGVLTEDQCFKATPTYSVSPVKGGAL